MRRVARASSVTELRSFPSSGNGPSGSRLCGLAWDVSRWYSADYEYTYIDYWAHEQFHFSNIDDDEGRVIVIANIETPSRAGQGY